MRVLVFGETGQLARALRRRAALTGDELRFLSRAEADLADPESCAAAIRAHVDGFAADFAPEAVINAAAWTAVDRAEAEEDAATLVNGAAPAAMARACAALNIPLVQISTDYVFDGAGDQPFRPDHPAAPLNAYGRSKLQGEVGVQAAGGAHAILRTSWVFSADGSNFLRTMLRLGAERAALNVVDDQIGGPTPAADIAASCLVIAKALARDPGLSGTYHLSGAPDTSWAGFARAIMAAADLPCEIHPIPSSAYPTPAPRPQNSRLDCQSLAVFGLERPDWRAALPDLIAQVRSPA